MRLSEHMLHCCLKHGCQFKDKDCPIANGDATQKYACSKCSKEDTKEINSNSPKEETSKEWAKKLSDEELCKYVEKIEKEGTKIAAATLELIDRYNKLKPIPKEETK